MVRDIHVVRSIRLTRDGQHDARNERHALRGHGQFWPNERMGLNERMVLSERMVLGVRRLHVSTVRANRQGVDGPHEDEYRVWQLFCPLVLHQQRPMVPIFRRRFRYYQQ